MMNPQLPALGIRFDIDKLEQADGGSYGKLAWLAFCRAADVGGLPPGSYLFEGDTAKTLDGGEYVYCLVVQSHDKGLLSQIRTTMSQSGEFKRFAATPQFVEDRSLYSEPLPQAGHVDAQGHLIVFQYSTLRTAVGLVQKERRAALSGSQVGASVAKRRKPGSPRTAKLPNIGSLEDLNSILKTSFAHPKHDFWYFVTPEELCDMVEHCAGPIQAYIGDDPFHFSGDSFCVVLFNRDEAKQGMILRFTGLFPFASAMDAVEYCRFEGGIDPSMWGIQGKYVMSFQGEDLSHHGLKPRKEDLLDSAVDADALWERICSRRAELDMTGISPVGSQASTGVTPLTSASKKWWQFWK